jgi:hypothetical protein
MPNDRIQRTRATLPEGYRFGDAHEHNYRALWKIVTDAYHAICTVCGHVAGPVRFPSGWYVIEGEHH